VALIKKLENCIYDKFTECRESLEMNWDEWFPGGGYSKVGAGFEIEFSEQGEMGIWMHKYKSTFMRGGVKIE
jgi:hypothetical protein